MVRNVQGRAAAGRGAPTGEPYIPDLGFVYPQKPDEHMISFKYEFPLTEDYPFLNKSPGFRILSFLAHIFIWTIAFAVCVVRFGLVIEGRRWLREYRGRLKNGAMTVSNHVHWWDFMNVLQAVGHRLYYPAWKENLSGPNAVPIRLSGGIPIPDDIHLFRYFNAAFDELHEKKRWFHVFPEGSMWFYYAPIRPFKRGMFTMAARYDIPVIPMAFSYRKSRGLYAFFKKNYPLLTLRIGEPIFPDGSLSKREAANKLREECHKSMVSLAGITDNPWPCEAD
jgi:1-acyl-sn-glycerol-3-phosphate acyltransferase